MKLIHTLSITVFSFALMQTNAQIINFFKDNIYNLKYNPATEITVQRHFSIPCVSNLNFQAGTNAFIYNDVVSLDNEGNKVIDPKGFFSKIPNSSYGEVFCNMNMEVLGFGKKISPRTYFMYSTRLQMENTLFIPKGLFQFATDGNLAHINEELTISPLLSALSYLDNSIGLQYKFSSRLTIGFRGKLLLGMLNANIRESTFTLMTDDEWNLHLKGSALLNVNFPKKLISTVPTPDGKYFIEDMKNMFHLKKLKLGTMLGALTSSWGGGFDVGLDMKLTDNLGVKTSIIDVGWIKWNRNRKGTINYRVDINPNHPLYKDGELVFTGITDITTIKWGVNTIDSFYNQVIKELVLDSALLISEVKSGSYVTMTNPKFFLEGYYNLWKIHKFSALLRMDFIEERVLTAFTLGYNLNIKKLIDIAFSYSLSKGSYNNIGLGVSLNLGNRLHLYAAADNMPTLFNLYNQAANVNVHTGLFFTIPAKKEKKTNTEEK